ncbi:signal peptide peptidase SppA, 36K type [Chthoniobacter flavus Ellin428]|uniref:Signal peptide peptidase SppA, 36K type n=1 Tax=Chthoniobacter flavus Ellin428 TaxID=497964 RepID=B4D455_9BACT|nr:signal peptide peptidase SppA [Chthoniobacter flavus]EDY18656.1 signal peptide peptidase SppA, 36K type [Chthoniobacter flavus Ellin428]TCO89105.1 signal peptide peptidase A [Chthoniobacter flavus]
MTQKNSGCLWMLAGFGLCLGFLTVLAIVFIVASGNSVRTVVMPRAPRFEESVVVDAKPTKDGKVTDSKIALIYLRGVISSSEPGALGESMVDDLKIQLEQAATDEKVKAVVLYVDSPGGEVTASDSIYDAVRKVREGGYGKKKPVVVYMGSLAASGGYYISCAGTWLMANETTLTGSIGVIMQSLNYKELFGKLGLQTVTFKSGQFKDMLSGSRDLTQEERDYIQKMVMDTYGKFVGIVAKERKLNEDELRHGLADGRVISGKDALAAKLINATGEVEDAYAKAMELGNARGATVIRYESPFKLGKLFRLLGQSEKTSVEVNLANTIRPKLEAGRLYFLPGSYAP